MTKEAIQIGKLIPKVKYQIKTNARVQYKLTSEIYDDLFKRKFKELQERSEEEILSFVVNDDNKKILECIKMYFVKDPDFNKDGIVSNNADLSKGLLIHGDVGVGKSFLFEILYEMMYFLHTNNGFKDIYFRTVSSEAFVKEYMYSVSSQKNKIPTNFVLSNYYKGKLYIDDLGLEDKAFNREEIFSKILFEREKRRNKTYITTNLPPSAISERYGERIGDRLPKMFNFIKWKGESFRDE